MKRQPPISRRTFLKITATAAAGAVLAGCTPGKNSPQPTETASPGATTTQPPSPTQTINTNVPTIGAPTQAGLNPTEARSSTPEQTATSSPAYLAVVHGPDPAAITRAAIEALGGITSFVSAGSD